MVDNKFDDTTESNKRDLMLAKALDALTRAQMVNRYWAFMVDGRVEIAFGSARSFQPDGSELSMSFDFPVGVSLDKETAIGLRDWLNRVLSPEDSQESH